MARSLVVGAVTVGVLVAAGVALLLPGIRSETASPRDGQQAAVDEGHFAYVATASYNTRAGEISSAEADVIKKKWTAPNGDAWTWRSESGHASCTSRKFRGRPAFGNIQQDWLAQLPTESDALIEHIRAQLPPAGSGDGSEDKAIFDAIDETLSVGQGLTPPALRTALLDALGKIGHVTVRAGNHDVLQRRATRVDFHDQALRARSRRSLYFDPSTSKLTQLEDSSTNGSKSGSVQVVTDEKVVNSLPAEIKSCPDVGE